MSEQHPAPDDTISALFDPILRGIRAEIGVDAVCVFADDSGTGDAQLRALAAPEVDFGIEQVRLTDLFAGRDEPVILKPAELSGTGFVQGLALPVMHDRKIVGMLGLFSSISRDFRPEDVRALAGWIPPLAALLDRQRLREQQRLNDAIQNAARLMADSTLPQEIANLMHLLSPKVTISTVSIYGPLREDSPGGPFEYAEIQGTWSKRHGSGIGIGLRVYLELYPDLLAELNANKVLVLPDVRAIEKRFDLLVRGFLQIERVRSMVLLTLGTAQRDIGIIGVATDRNIPFTPQEINSLRMASEFLAVSASTRILQQQHDLVQQGRAALLDAVTDGVVMVVPGRRASAREGHVLTVNHSFSGMFNVSQDRAQGLPLSQLLEHLHLPEETAASLAQQWLKIPVNNPSTQRGELEMIHVDGYAMKVEWYSAPVYQDNHVMGRIYTFHDVSAERAAEKLRANFISRLSHELRTPLSNIQGYAQFLLEEHDAALSTRAREYVQIIFDSSQGLSRMFTDVILVARADTGELKLAMETTMLPGVIEHTCHMYEARANARGQTIQLDIEEALPRVYVDAHYIGRVVGELLKNAILYGPPDHAIRLRAAHLTKPRQFPQGTPADVPLPAVLVSVTDGGGGFSGEEAEAVFLPFYRGKNANAAQIEGTGLGLTIAQSITMLHRGKIWAETRRRGRRVTRFHLALPMVEG